MNDLGRGKPQTAVKFRQLREHVSCKRIAKGVGLDQYKGLFKVFVVHKTGSPKKGFLILFPVKIEYAANNQALSLAPG
jgi:hypothetical protein